MLLLYYCSVQFNNLLPFAYQLLPQLNFLLREKLKILSVFILNYSFPRIPHPKIINNIFISVIFYNQFRFYDLFDVYCFNLLCLWQYLLASPLASCHAKNFHMCPKVQITHVRAGSRNVVFLQNNFDSNFKFVLVVLATRKYGNIVLAFFSIFMLQVILFIDFVLKFYFPKKKLNIPFS